MSRHVLITGGAGFIGSHLIDHLLAQGGWRVTSVDNFDPFYDRAIKESNIAAHRDHSMFRFVEADVLDENLAERVVQDGGGAPDIVVHLAAKAGVRPSIKDPLAYHKVNVEGTLRMLAMVKQLSVQRFILASSSSVYGENPNVPWSEDLEGLEPISPYAVTKVCAEQFAQVHARLHGTHITALRFFTVYGPRQRPDLAIHRFFRNISSGVPIQQYGDGTTQRDYTFVDDIVRGVVAAMDRNKGAGFEIYNLGNSDTVMLRDLIQAVEHTVGRKALIDLQPEQPGDVPRTFANVSKALRDLGFAPSTPLAKGLDAFHAWFLAREGGQHVR